MADSAPALDPSVVNINFDEIRALVAEVDTGPLLKSFDAILGAALVVGAGVTGIGSLLALIDPKNELAKVAQEVAGRLAGAPHETEVERYTRYAAAYQLVVFSSFFAVADGTLRRLVPLTAYVEVDALDLAVTRAVPRTRSGTSTWQSPVTPHPSWNLIEREAELEEVFAGFTEQLGIWARTVVRQVERLVEESDAALPTKEQAEAARDSLRDLAFLADEAMREYWGRITALSRENDGFYRWLGLRNEARIGSQLMDVRDEVRAQAEVLQGVKERLDIGLRALELPKPPQPSDSDRVFRELAAEYGRVVTRPVVEGYVFGRDGALDVRFPAAEELFIPQACRVLTCRQQTRLEDPLTWADRAVHADVCEYVIHHLRSPYSCETPLLILGHPGAGKSLLTAMLAARLAGPSYKPVRVSLRSVDARSSPAEMVENEIRRVTTRRIDWSMYCEAGDGEMPLVILDGFDELLLTTDAKYSRFLFELAEFQRRELALNRGVRIIVTSRPALMDLVALPEGMTCLQLERFDAQRQEAWMSIWNEHNRAIYEERELEPLRLPRSTPISELVDLPLLLLLLAVYSTTGDGLTGAEDLGRTELYARLIDRFIGREHQRSDQPSESDKDFAESRRHALQVVALGMFNRRSLKATPLDLSADIEYAACRPIPADTRELLRGFFFIHEAQAVESCQTPTFAYEFLHNTFGEFLLAEVLHRYLLDVVRNDVERRPEAPTWWYAATMHAPLYSRREVLRMLREWGSRSADTPPRVWQNMDSFIRRELLGVAFGTLLPRALTRPDTPYRPSGLIERLATYSINLVLLRLSLRPEAYRVDIASEDGTSSLENWHRLRGLWATWLNIAEIDDVCDWYQQGEEVFVTARPDFHRRGFMSGVPVSW